MEREAKKRNLSFLSAKYRAHNLYGIDMTEDDFIEMAYPVWRDIGNISTKQYRYYVQLADDYIVQLPTYTESVDSVTLVDQPEYRDTYDSSGPRRTNQAATLTTSNFTTLNQSITQSPGRTVNYILRDSNSIQITSPDIVSKNLMIVYSAIDQDDDGLPLLNDKEVAAVAAETARRYITRKAFQLVGMKDKSTPTLLQIIIPEAERLMAAAKIDEKLNDDAIDKMLDIKTSWDRKVYGSRFSTIR